MFDQELQFFDEHLAEWLTQFPEQYVLTKETKLVGIFENIEDALSEGARLYGFDNFLVRKTIPSPEPIFIPVLMPEVMNTERI